MNTSYTAIQSMIFPDSIEEANSVFQATSTQEGFLGGRVLNAGGGKPVRVQTFFQSDVQIQDWTKVDELNASLPDGMTYNLIMTSQAPALGIR